MALNTGINRETRSDVMRRFGIAQDGRPSQEQLDVQADIRNMIAEVAADINSDIADSREKSLALTHLEEALMWAGKAIFS